MEAPMAKGTAVRQKVVAIEGVVIDVRFDADKLAFTYEVGYKEGDDVHRRWFSAAEIEAKKEDA